jgi:hypothetical protein
MAFDAFLKIDGIPGESTDEKREAGSLGGNVSGGWDLTPILFR